MLLFAKDIATGSRLSTTFPKARAPNARVSTCERQMKKGTGIPIMRKKSRQPGSIPSAEPERLEMLAVLFDLDGTLIDSNYQHVDAWSEVLLEADIVIPRRKIHRRVGTSGKSMMRELLRETAQLGLPGK